MGKRRTLEKIDQPIRILVTGGFGYVGGRVAQHLVEKGYQVVLGSRKIQSSPDWLPQSEVVQLRWDDEAALAEICNSVNVVIHTAGMNAQDCAFDPVAALEFNGLATARLMRASINEGITKFIYLSTAHVYRSPLVGEIDEKTCPRNLHPYASSHLAGENAVLYGSQNESDFSGIVLRLSNVVGSPVSKDVNCWMLLVNDLCKQAIIERSLTLNGDSKTVRDFVAIRDFCSVIEVLIESNNTSNIVNIGSGKVCTVGEMATKIQSSCLNMLGFEPPIIFKQKPSMNKNLFNLQTSYLDSIGFKFANNFDLEIEQLISFCVKNFPYKS